MDKPTARVQEARWLEVPEAALLLEAARTFKPKRDDIAVPFAYPLLATCLLTGGRPAEVLGLEVDDINLERRIVTFRPNAWRRLKTLTSNRSVPLWPQLEEILREQASLVNRVYGHLGTVRHRSDVVEYRVEQHKQLKYHDKAVIEWVKALRRLRAA